MRRQIAVGGIVACVAAFAVVPQTRAEPVTVTIENLSGTDGLYFTPMWLGFHNGSFDVFSPGVATTAGGGLERLAEDGDTSVLSGEFAASAAGLAGGIDTTVTAPAGFPGAPVFDPGDSASMNFNLDPTNNRYLSYASMVIPSNDAFIGNANPLGIELFDGSGVFTGPFSFTVLGSMVWDAGTEANTEMNAAFFDQTTGNTGTTTADPVASHAGFIDSFGNPGGTAVILGGTSTAPPGIFFDAIAADFTQPGFELARITVTPEPATAVLLAGAGICGLRLRRRKTPTMNGNT